MTADTNLPSNNAVKTELKNKIYAVIEELFIGGGRKPSYQKTRERLGGVHSYSTIKKVMDVWRTEREPSDERYAELPDSIQSIGEASVIQIWKQALKLARQEASVRNEELVDLLEFESANLIEAHGLIDKLQNQEAELLKERASLGESLERTRDQATESELRVAKLEERLANARREIEAKEHTIGRLQLEGATQLSDKLDKVQQMIARKLTSEVLSKRE